MKKSSNTSLGDAAAQLEKQLTSPTVTLILASATIGAIVYMVFLLQPAYRGDLLPYLMVIVAELFLICHGIVSFWTILSGRFNPRNFNYHHAQNNLFNNPPESALELSKTPLYLNDKKVSVDVFIPVYGEAVSEINATALAARDMYGAHQTYILDDGKSDAVKDMAKRVGVGYIRRPTNNHAKAGNINYALTQTKGTYFIILDADFIADKHFIVETLPFFENKKVAFVQTPQYYSNQKNFVSTAAGFMQHVFYSLVQVGKNRFNAAFCVGTNVIFRRSAIEKIGGIYFQSKSEDIWTSLILHEQGYQSVYINKVLAIGKTPETIKAYSKQQLRWATGSFEIFLHKNPLFNKKLTVDQRIQYFATTAFYFNGFAVATLLLLPALQIFFNITPIALDIPFYQWALLYSGFYVTQIILSMYTMGGLKVETLMLSAASFPIYIKAFFNALFKRDEAWQATNRVDSYDSPFNYIRIQTYIFIFLLLTTAVGVWKSVYTSEFSVSIAWCALNTYIFGYFIFVAMRESSQMRRSTKKISKHNNRAPSYIKKEIKA
ncbi:MAG: Glycosyl transferase family 2 [Candidatus Saccharibacteria bacterium GW2011_GWC2_48_9]|nr:MAG: Glycosyl transferase family 2 [Candidatus Saccharibacteria bacterium GW2011_GWC2_48_9]HCH34627.1 glycosyl transferase family 2 [Candidatus Saccharibacteria bacterium]